MKKRNNRHNSAKISVQVLTGSTRHKNAHQRARRDSSSQNYENNRFRLMIDRFSSIVSLTVKVVSFYPHFDKLIAQLNGWHWFRRKRTTYRSLDRDWHLRGKLVVDSSLIYARATIYEHGQTRVYHQRESKRSFRVTSSSGTVGLKRARRLTLINPLLGGQREPRGTIAVAGEVGWFADETRAEQRPRTHQRPR